MINHVSTFLTLKVKDSIKAISSIIITIPSPSSIVDRLSNKLLINTGITATPTLVIALYIEVANPASAGSET